MPSIDNALFFAADSQSSPFSESFTCNASATLLYVAIMGDATGFTPTGITYNGVSISTTPLASTGTQSIDLYGPLTNPASGANTLEITHAGTVDHHIFVISVIDGDTSTPQSTPVTDENASSASLDIATASTSDGLVVGVTNFNNVAPEGDLTTTDTEVVTTFLGGHRGHAASASGTGASVTIDWTLDGVGQRNSGIVWNINAISAASGGAPLIVHHLKQQMSN